MLTLLTQEDSSGLWTGPAQVETVPNKLTEEEETKNKHQVKLKMMERPEHMDQPEPEPEPESRL